MEAEIRLEDGKTYKGEMKNGKPHGLGTLIWPNGDIY